MKETRNQLHSFVLVFWFFYCKTASFWISTPTPLAATHILRYPLLKLMSPQEGKTMWCVWADPAGSHAKGSSQQALTYEPLPQAWFHSGVPGIHFWISKFFDCCSLFASTESYLLWPVSSDQFSLLWFWANVAVSHFVISLRCKII